VPRRCEDLFDHRPDGGLIINDHYTRHLALNLLKLCRRVNSVDNNHNAV
jgi:hypothetical protein